MWSWTWFITLNATEINGSAPQNHCISQLKSLLCLRKERLCRLNEFHWLNVFACHSGAKSYLMADTQFMAGPPFSQWQVTFVTRKALWEGRAKDRALHSWKGEHKCCAWEMKWEKSGWFAHSAAAQLRLGYRPQPDDLTVPDWDLTRFGRRFCFFQLRKSTNFISVSPQQLPWLLGEKCRWSLIN